MEFPAWMEDLEALGYQEHQVGLATEVYPEILVLQVSEHQEKMEFLDHLVLTERREKGGLTAEMAAQDGMEDQDLAEVEDYLVLEEIKEEWEIPALTETQASEEAQGTPVKGDHQVPEAWTVRLDLQEEVASPAGMVILADLELEETVEPLETLDRIMVSPDHLDPQDRRDAQETPDGEATLENQVYQDDPEQLDEPLELLGTQVVLELKESVVNQDLTADLWLERTQIAEAVQGPPDDLESR